MTTPLYVQYGCGTCSPDGWVNFDCSPTLRLQRLPLLAPVFRTASSVTFPQAVRYGDIVRGLPVADGSATAVYCSHVLEHLSLHDFRIALVNTFRILRSEGTFRMVLPDLRFMATRYVEDDGPESAPTFMRETMLGVETRPRGFGGFLRSWLGNTRHLWMWDYASLSRELVSAGFTSPRPARFHDSTDEMFKAVENESRWRDALGIECRRP